MNFGKKGGNRRFFVLSSVVGLEDLNAGDLDVAADLQAVEVVRLQTMRVRAEALLVEEDLERAK